MLDGFKVYYLTTGLPTISITLNGVSFNKTAIVKMEYPEHVLLMINSEEKKIAIQACDADSPGATPYFRKRKGRDIVSVRWNNRDLLSTISKIMGWDLKDSGYRAQGDYLENENAIVFDLSQATPI